MILKVKTGEGGWKFYEGFGAAQVSVVPGDQGVAADEYHWQDAQGTSKEVILGGKATMSNEPVRRVRMVRLYDPGEKTVVFDTEGYLLNQDGKTIEKL